MLPIMKHPVQTKSSIYLLLIYLKIKLCFAHMESFQYAHDPLALIDIHETGVFIEKLNSSTVEIKLGDRYQHNKALFGIDRLMPTVTVNYSLMLHSILIYQEHDLCGPESFFDVEKRNHELVGTEHRERCHGLINTFGTPEGTLGTSHESPLLKYCDLRNDAFTARNVPGPRMLLQDLLPGLPYLFNITVSISTDEEETGLIHEPVMIKSNCTLESHPLYPPQTDLGSLIFDPPSRNTNRDTSFRLIELYWRTVPIFFTGTHLVHYHVNCFDSKNRTVFEEDYNERGNGIASIDSIFGADSYTCKIDTRNRLGKSEKYSTISIPAKENVLSTKGLFKLFVLSSSVQEFYLRWTDIRILGLDVEATNSTNEEGKIKGIYTLYWCIAVSPNHGCSSLEGMIRSKDTKENIRIPGAKGEQRIFGISYRSPDNKKTTGIIWSECIGMMNSQTQSVKDPLKLEASSVLDNHTAISVSWDVRGCRSLLISILRYELKYCLLNSIETCSSTNLLKDKYHPEEIKERFDNNVNCTTIRFENDLNSKYQITGLSSSTRYAIGIRHIVSDYDTPWSKIVRTHTMPDPDLCRSNSVYKISLLLVVLSLILIYLVYMIHTWYNIISRFLRTKTQLPDRVKQEPLNKDDDISYIDLKYWVDRCPSSVKSEFSENLELTSDEYNLDEESFSSVKVKHSPEQNDLDSETQQYVENSDYTLGYITEKSIDDCNNLLPGSPGAKTRENSEDCYSNPDEIYSSSQSSFLDRILSNSGNVDYKDETNLLF